MSFTQKEKLFFLNSKAYEKHRFYCQRTESNTKRYPLVKKWGHRQMHEEWRERQKQLKHGEISMIIGFKENNNNNYSNVVTTVIINSHGEFTIYFYMYTT